MNEWLERNLVCPRDHQKLTLKDNKLTCADNHTYPVIDDIPVMLLEEIDATHGYIKSTLEKVSKIEADKNSQVEDKAESINGVDSFVQREISLTSGILYLSLTNKLTRYPIPHTRLWKGNGERLLDVGCNWGRWSISAAQKGFKPIGIDPNLDACLAARRVSKQLGVETDFVVGDARFLPFAKDAFDVVFSYGVLQHFSKENAKTSMDEMGRVLKTDGKILIQMPNKLGVRSFYHQVRRGFAEGEGFDVRYWTPSELIKTFKEKFGETEIFADCYFGLGIQKSDVDLLPAPYKAVVYSSEALRKMSETLSFMTNFADSVYLKSINQK